MEWYGRRAAECYTALSATWGFFDCVLLIPEAYLKILTLDAGIRYTRAIARGEMTLEEVSAAIQTLEDSP